jgi:hypothetical protein
MYLDTVETTVTRIWKYAGKSISKLQMDIELKQTRVLIW